MLRSMSWANYDRSTLTTWDQTAYYHVAQHAAKYFMHHHIQHGHSTEKLTLLRSLQQEYGDITYDRLRHVPYLEILYPDGRSGLLDTIFDRREHILSQPYGTTAARSEIIQQGTIIVLGWVADRGLDTALDHVVTHAVESDLIDTLLFQDKLRLHYMQYFVWCTMLCAFEGAVAANNHTSDLPWEWSDPLLVASFLERVSDSTVPHRLADWLVAN